jgi:DNA mismatch repair protein MutS
MAQAGMFVPATTMNLSPFRHLFTRISGMDNIYKGMSTFVVEMAELRNILQRCDRYSIVLGDELCAGTESTSATAIVAAGVDCLINKKCPFIFATHLHELAQLPIVTTNVNIHIYHMHIELDPQTQKIIYDRKLKIGTGSNLYGLEVCRSLAMPDAFLRVADNVRRTLTEVPEQLVKCKWSRYNRKVAMTKCGVCEINDAVDTHHIRYQCEGYIGNGVDLHQSSNLVPLCKTCHDLEHHGQLCIKGYRQTTSGVELDYEYIDPQQKPYVSTIEAIATELRVKYKYTASQWYSKTAKNQTWRKCSYDTVAKHILKKYDYILTCDDAHVLSGLLHTL